MQDDLTRADSHFEFGKNWASYAEKISASEIDEAEQGLQKLLGDRLDGMRFLDIGCGSGLHALAALRLGAREVLAVDIDADSVSTTEAVLQRFAPDKNWRVRNKSVFELQAPELQSSPGTTGEEDFGRFDIVYSWGVLHHTGDMHKAIRCASALVDEGGRFAFALYRRIWMDWFWRQEKRWYTKSSSEARRRARWTHVTLFKLGLFATGRSFKRYVTDYFHQRGMDFDHDVHDWMGGWPYESISPEEVETLMCKTGFESERVYARRGRFFGRDLGLFGSGCDEYVYRRV